MIKLAGAALGKIPADLVIKDARIANIFTNSYERADVAVYSGKIAGIGEYSGLSEFDAGGRVLIPGMIDGHIHIEDTMMTPENFADSVACLGTSTVMADPHEIANALGMSGLEYMYRASRGLDVDVFLGAPSCVPASEFETPYEELDMCAISSMFARNMTQHLGEMMNFPAVIAGDEGAWAKILAAGNVPLTGHAPGVSGKELNAYLSSGISSDHECTTLDETREKLSRGMWLMIRAGATFHDIDTLLPIILENELNASRCMIVSDDITAKYILEQGHMDVKMRMMLKAGISPFVALRMVTLSPAEYFRLYDRGIIAPGKTADFALLDSDVIDENFSVSHVWKNGSPVVRRNHDTGHEAPVLSLSSSSLIRIKNIPEDISIKACGELMNVIGVTEGTVITKTLQVIPKVENGCVVPDPVNDIAKIIVLERHKDTGSFGLGFVKGLGIVRGAVGSSVAHDAHNFVVAGADDESILRALHELAEMGGGLVVCEGGCVKSEFPLPIGGLMSYLTPGKVCAELADMEEAARNIGVKIPHPFMVLSFLQLSVIPELRITDKGYIDITKGGIQKIFVR